MNCFDWPCDDADLRLLHELVADGRVSFDELGMRTQLGSGTARRRVARLIDEGVIERFTAVVKLSALGQFLDVWGVIELRESSFRAAMEFEQRLSSLSEVWECQRLVPHPTYLVRVVCKDERHLSYVRKELVADSDLGVRALRVLGEHSLVFSRRGLPVTVFDVHTWRGAYPPPAMRPKPSG